MVSRQMLVRFDHDHSDMHVHAMIAMETNFEVSRQGFIECSLLWRYRDRKIANVTTTRTVDNIYRQPRNHLKATIGDIR